MKITMVALNVWFQFDIIFIILGICFSQIPEPSSKRLDTLFREIGFSPTCVSKTLALCEESESRASLHDIKEQMKSMEESIKDLNKRKSLPRNCAELLKRGDKESGVRIVYPFSSYQNRPVPVFCDQTTDGGGWTVIQHREDLPKRENFFRTWIEYQIGFGNLTGEFWLGLENIHALVSETLMELKVDLEDFEGQKRWANYEYFHIGNSVDKYKLSLGTYSGDAGDSLATQNGQKFSTKDNDNDVYGDNCALKFKGAWWYNACHRSNLNGYQYEGHHDSYADGINWYTFQGHNYSLKEATLRLKPKFEIYTIIK